MQDVETTQMTDEQVEYMVEVMRPALEEVTKKAAKEEAEAVVSEMAEKAVAQQTEVKVLPAVQDAVADQVPKAVAEAAIDMVDELQNLPDGSEVGVEADVSTPGSDTPGIMAFGNVNALIRKKGEIELSIAADEQAIIDLEHEIQTRIQKHQNQIMAKKSELNGLPEQAHQELVRVYGRVREAESIFGLTSSLV